MACLVSEEEFTSFHRIDRELYKILVMKLGREPRESMQILGFWLWLERVGFCSNLVKKIVSLPMCLIKEVAEEAMRCLNCLRNDMPVLEKEGRLSFLCENREKAMEGVAKMVEDVCVRALGDIMQQAQVMRMRGTGPAAGRSKEEDRTVFMTFSKGHPVEEWEVREFVRTTYGDCIEQVHMQEVGAHEQALFARIVFKFHAASTIDVLLKGATKAKFIINGKHVWARKFVPKPSSSTSSTFLPYI